MPNTVYDSFTDEYKLTLSQIKENFEENLFRIISDNFDRIKAYNTSAVPIKDLGKPRIQTDDKKILIQNIELVLKPKYELKELLVSFKDLSLTATIEISDLKVNVNSDKDSNNVSLEKGSDEVIVLPKIIYQGIIGMKTEEDSFVPENFYNKFILQSTSPNCDNTLKQSIVDLLIPYFENVIFKEIAGTVVDFSLSELLIDEPEDIKNHEEHRLTIINSKIDNWLQKLISKSPVSFTSDYNISVNVGNDVIIELQSVPNTINLQNFKRAAPSTLIADNLYIVNGVLEDSKCDVKYKKIVNSKIVSEGTLTAKIYKNSILMAFKLKEKSVEINQKDLYDVNIFATPENVSVEEVYPYMEGYVREYLKSLYSHISTLFEDFQQ